MCVNHCCGRCVCVSKFICCGDQINTIKHTNSPNQKKLLTKTAKDMGYTNIVTFVDAAVIIGLKTLRLKKCCKFGIF